LINERELIIEGFTDGIKSKNIQALKCLLALIPVVVVYFFFSIYITGFTWFVGACFIIIPNLVIVNKEKFNALNQKEKKFYLEGYSHVVLHFSLSVYLSLTLIIGLLLYMAQGFAINW